MIVIELGKLGEQPHSEGKHPLQAWIRGIWNDGGKSKRKQYIVKFKTGS